MTDRRALVPKLSRILELAEAGVSFDSLRSWKRRRKKRKAKLSPAALA